VGDKSGLFEHPAGALSLWCYTYGPSKFYRATVVFNSCEGGFCVPSDTPVLILPGFDNSGPEHWQTLWELRHPDWRRVNLGKWDAPACDDWVRALDVAVQACPSPPVLVAHSLACLLVAHWAYHSSRIPKGAFLVAVPDPKGVSFPAAAQGFVPVPLVPFMFRSIVVASANDQLGSLAHAKHCAMAWGSMFIDIGEAGHINAESGHGEWNEGYELFRQYVAE
jgi:predicted alpha/beta hydrolase family esterase